MFDSMPTIGPPKVPQPTAIEQGLAKAIINILQHKSSMQQAFYELYQAAGEEVKRLVKYWQLGLVVEDEQINNTVTDFIEDLSGSPDDKPILARLLAMTLRQPANLLDQLQFYASRRIFTLLKRNASKASQEYLAFNNTIKKNLNDLSADGQIKKLAASYWTAGTSSQSIAADTGLMSPSVLSRLPLQRQINSAGRHVCHKLEQSILQLLNSPEHLCYKFKTSSISTALYNLNISPLQCLSSLHEPQPDEIALQTPPTCEFNAMAGCMLEQIVLQIPDRDRLQVLMAGLAYCFIVCPDYFDQNDFTINHVAILTSNKGEIDRIHEFLNTESFRDLFNKEPGRSTAYNRVSSFKTLLESSLVDFPVEVQQTGIKDLAGVLIYHYRKLAGREK